MAVDGHVERIEGGPAEARPELAKLKERIASLPGVPEVSRISEVFFRYMLENAKDVF